MTLYSQSMSRSLLAVLSLVLLAGCATTEIGHPPLDYSNSVNQNIAVQVVNPNALSSNNETLSFEGNRAAEGQQRYVTDNSEELSQST